MLHGALLLFPLAQKLQQEDVSSVLMAESPVMALSGTCVPGLPYRPPSENPTNLELAQYNEYLSCESLRQKTVEEV